MLDRQRKIVQSTVPVLQEHGETITRVFYRHLLEEHPELASMFNARDQSDGSQARRLAAAVLAYASNIDRLHMLESAITSIGRKHVSLNVRPEQYPIVGKHLLGAIKTVLGDAATPEILDAWAAAYAQLADIMIAREKDLYIERNESREQISSSTGDKNEIASSYFKSVPELPVRKAKTAIVTGASSGIGLELAKKLSLNGYRVVANSRRITSARTLVETEHIKLVDGDISLPETAERVVSTAIQHFGTIDLLVNNAGVFLPKPFTEYTTEDLRVAFATNLFGFFFVSQLAVARMRLQKSGHVVNLTTSIVSQPIAGLPASLANLSKGGLESVTRALAIEYADEGIRFNTIAPGVVNTPMHAMEAHEFLKQLSPMKRLAEADEVADLLLYMEAAPFLNGAVVHLDGGAHAGKWA